MKRFIRTDLLRALAIVVGALICFRVLSSFADVPKTRENSDQLSKIPLTTVQALRGPQTVEAIARGTLRSARQHTVRAPISGIFYAKAWLDGLTVAEGELFGRIIDNELNAQVSEARLALAAQLGLLLPRVQSEFPDEVADWNAYYKALLEAKLTDVPETKNKRLLAFLAANQILQAIERYQRLLSRSSLGALRTPFPGRIVSRTVDHKQWVPAGTVLGQFETTDTQLIATIHPRYSRILENILVPGSEIKGTWSFADKLSDLTIQSIRPLGRVDELSQMPLYSIDLQSSKPDLLAGSVGTLSFRIPSIEHAVSIPATSILQSGNNNQILLFDESSALSWVSVEIVYRDEQRAIVHIPQDREAFVVVDDARAPSPSDSGEYLSRFEPRKGVPEKNKD
jgi:hypothetical protein